MKNGYHAMYRKEPDKSLPIAKESLLVDFLGALFTTEENQEMKDAKINYSEDLLWVGPFKFNQGSSGLLETYQILGGGGPMLSVWNDRLLIIKYREEHKSQIKDDATPDESLQIIS